MIQVTRRYRFAALHRLHVPSFSEEKNRELFGKCNNPFGHGHDYVLDVTVQGPVDQETGLAVHVPTLDKLVGDSVLKDFDHQNINKGVAEFEGLVPTSENIVCVIERRLRAAWPSAFEGQWPRLENVRLQETRRNRFQLRP